MFLQIQYVKLCIPLENTVEISVLFNYKLNEKEKITPIKLKGVFSKKNNPSSPFCIGFIIRKFCIFVCIIKIIFFKWQDIVNGVTLSIEKERKIKGVENYL